VCVAVASAARRRTGRRRNAPSYRRQACRFVVQIEKKEKREREEIEQETEDAYITYIYSLYTAQTDNSHSHSLFLGRLLLRSMLAEHTTCATVRQGLGTGQTPRCPSVACWPAGQQAHVGGPLPPPPPLSIASHDLALALAPKHPTLLISHMISHVIAPSPPSHQGHDPRVTLCQRRRTHVILLTNQEGARCPPPVLIPCVLSIELLLLRSFATRTPHLHPAGEANGTHMGCVHHCSVPLFGSSRHSHV
jgi:hypothetical protein